MRRQLPWLALLLLAGCARPPRYDVYVTGYTGGPPTSISPGAKIVVLPNPAAGNPLLEQEIVAKAQRALAAYGFRPVPATEAAFVIMLRYGAESREVHGTELKVVPGQQVTVKDTAGKVVGTATTDMSFTTEPTTSTGSLQWLTMTAVDGAQYRQLMRGAPIWIGEAKSFDTNLDLRSVLDYLVAPTASALGHNQTQRRVAMGANDVAVRALRQQP